MRVSPAFSLVLGVSTAACGARSGLAVPSEVAGDAGVEASVRDAGATLGCTLQAGPVQRVTSVRSGASLLDVVRGPNDSTWISWSEALDAPVEFMAYMLTSVDAAGARVFEREGLRRPRLLTGFVKPAEIEFDRAANEGAALAWDSDNGCIMQRYDENGVARGAPFDPLTGSSGFMLGRCTGLRANAEGWDLFAHEVRALEGVTLMRRARDGAFIAATNLLELARNGPALVRASSDDGSFLLGWWFGDGGDGRVMVQRFSRDGAPRSGPTALLDPPRPVRSLALLEMPDGVFAAWWHQPSGVEPSAAYQLRTREGAARGAAVTLATAGERFAGAFAATYAEGAPLVSYATTGRGMGLEVQRIAVGGAASSTVRVVEGVRSISSSRLVALDDGALVVFAGVVDQPAAQIYAAPLRCR